MITMTYVTGVRRYRTTGDFSHDNTIMHTAKHAAIEDAHFAVVLADTPYDESFLPTLPTNIYVRDLSTGRFIKWRN